MPTDSATSETTLPLQVPNVFTLPSSSGLGPREQSLAADHRLIGVASLLPPGAVSSLSEPSIAENDGPIVPSGLPALAGFDVRR
jgi:hypothetical protein